MFHLGQIEQAIGKYQEAISISKHFSDAYNNWGLALFHQGNTKEAIAKYSKALEYNKQNSMAWNNYGFALYHLGNFPDAEVKYGKAIEYNPYNVQALTNWGLLLEQKDRIKDASYKFKKAASVDSENIDILMKLGTLHMRLKEYTEAANAFGIAAALAPSNQPQLGADARWKYGKALKHLGQEEEAEKEFKTARQLYPEYAESVGSPLYRLTAPSILNSLSTLEREDRRSGGPADLGNIIRNSTCSRVREELKEGGSVRDRQESFLNAAMSRDDQFYEGNVEMMSIMKESWNYNPELLTGNLRGRADTLKEEAGSLDENGVIRLYDMNKS